VAKPLLNPLSGGDSAHGALKVCSLLGREATTSFISLQRQLFGLLAAPTVYSLSNIITLLKT